MPRNREKLSVVYSSGLMIDGPLLATLAVFFDEVWFPYPLRWAPGRDPRPIIDVPGSADYQIDLIKRFQEKYAQWQRRYRALFTEDILRILPWSALPDHEVEVGIDFAFKISLVDRDGDFEMPAGADALALHAVYAKKPAAEIFVQEAEDTTLAIATRLAHSLFQYEIPELAALPEEAILDCRDAVSRYKEGFRDYLFSLSPSMTTSHACRSTAVGSTSPRHAMASGASMNAISIR